MGQRRRGAGPDKPTGTERRFRRLLAKQARSGLSGAAFARQQGIPVTTLSWWRREVERRDQARAKRRASLPRPPALFPVRVVAPIAGPVAPLEVVLPGGIVVRVPSGADPAQLRAVLTALEGVC